MSEWLERLGAVVIGARVPHTIAWTAAWVLPSSGCNGPAPAPERSDLARVGSRFPEVRDKLERIIGVERETHMWIEERDSLIAEGESERVRRADERMQQMRAEAGFEGENMFRSDSLIHVSVRATRGSGFSAPKWYVGYVHASRSPADRFEWPIPGTHAVPFPGEYRHLADRWYLFSIDDPWQEGPKHE